MRLLPDINRRLRDQIAAQKRRDGRLLPPEANAITRAFRSFPTFEPEDKAINATRRDSMKDQGDICDITISFFKDFSKNSQNKY